MVVIINIDWLFVATFWMNELKRLLAEIKNVKLHTNNNVKLYTMLQKNIYGNPKSLNLSLINLAYH